MRFIVADQREVVALSVSKDTAAGGVLALNGKFPVKRRILEITDGQVALFKPALAALCEAKILFPPAGWDEPRE